MPTFVKSAGAVVAGFASATVTVLVLTWITVLAFFGGDMTAEPAPPYLAVNLSYSFAAAVLAGWLAARLAPRKPFSHAVAVAVLVFLLSLGGSGAEAEGASQVPSWYGTVLTTVMPVGALLGGWLRTRGTPAAVDPAA